MSDCEKISFLEQAARNERAIRALHLIQMEIPLVTQQGDILTFDACWEHHALRNMRHDLEDTHDAAVDDFIYQAGSGSDKESSDLHEPSFSGDPNDIERTTLFFPDRLKSNPDYLIMLHMSVIQAILYDYRASGHEIPGLDHYNFDTETVEVEPFSQNMFDMLKATASTQEERLQIAGVARILKEAQACRDIVTGGNSEFYSSNRRIYMDQQELFSNQPG